MDAGDQHCGVKTSVGDAVAVAVGDAFDEAVGFSLRRS